MATDKDPSMPPSRNLTEVVPGCCSGSNLPPSSPRSWVLRHLSHQNHTEAAYGVIEFDTQRGVPRPPIGLDWVCSSHCPLRGGQWPWVTSHEAGAVGNDARSVKITREGKRAALGSSFATKVYNMEHILTLPPQPRSSGVWCWLGESGWWWVVRKWHSGCALSSQLTTTIRNSAFLILLYAENS